MHKYFKWIFDPIFLGWAGVFPFFFSTILVLTNSEFENQARVMGLLYSTIILCFLGSVHWGYLLVIGKTNNNIGWLWGVLTPLLAWVSLGLIVIFESHEISSLLITVGLILSLIIDNKTFNAIKWYLNLRKKLTFFAIMSTLINGLF